jgi:hypothetical protein
VDHVTHFLADKAIDLKSITTRFDSVPLQYDLQSIYTFKFQLTTH